MADLRVRDRSQPWTPLLAERSDDVLRVVRAIVDLISGTSRSKTDFTLADGDAGIAMLYAYFANAAQDDAYAQRARRYLARAVRKSNRRTRIDLSLYDGVTGIGWASRRVAELCGEGAGVELGDLDALVLRILAEPPRYFPCELVRGVVGLAVYGLERPRETRWRAALDGLIAHLRATAVETPLGLTWFTDLRSLPNDSHSRSRCPDGLYNLGMAHGISGIVALLASLAQQRIGGDETVALLDGATQWLVAQGRTDSHGIRRWPIWIDHAANPTITSATWWCYGEPGLAIALQRAASVLDSEAIARTASGILLEGSMRARSQPGPFDPCLCHGAAGLAQICARSCQIRDDESVRMEAAWWYDRLLSHAHGLVDSCTGVPSALSPGLLTGLAGMALTLLSAITDREPCWDRMFLLSNRGNTGRVTRRLSGAM